LRQAQRNQRRKAARAKIVIAVFEPSRPIAVEVIFETAADIEAVAIGVEEAVDGKAVT